MNHMQQSELQNESVVSNNSAPQASTDQIQHNQVSQQHHVTKSKLPKLVLPKFKVDRFGTRTIVLYTKIVSCQQSINSIICTLCSKGQLYVQFKVYP